MIVPAFYQFLTSDETLNDPVREQGRQNLRKLVGSNIYHGRRPRGAGPVCLALQRSSGLKWSRLAVPAPFEAPIIDVHIFAKDEEDQAMSGSEVVERVYDALTDLLPQYRGPFGDRIVQTIDQEGEPFERPIRDEEAQDNWTYHYVIPYMIGAERVVPSGAN